MLLFLLLFNSHVSKTSSEILHLSNTKILKEKIQHIIIFLSKNNSVCSVGSREYSSTHVCCEFEHTLSNIRFERHFSKFQQTDTFLWQWWVTLGFGSNLKKLDLNSSIPMESSRNQACKILWENFALKVSFSCPNSRIWTHNSHLPGKAFRNCNRAFGWLKLVSFCNRNWLPCYPMTYHHSGKHSPEPFWKGWFIPGVFLGIC